MGGMAGPPQGQGTGPETRRVSGAGLSPAQHREEGEPDEPRDADGIAFSVLLGVGEKQAGSSEGQRLQTAAANTPTHAAESRLPVLCHRDTWKRHRVFLTHRQ